MFHCFNLGLALRSLRYKLVCVYIMKRLEFEPQGGAFPNETSLSTPPSGGGLITPPNLWKNNIHSSKRNNHSCGYKLECISKLIHQNNNKVIIKSFVFVFEIILSGVIPLISWTDSIIALFFLGIQRKFVNEKLTKFSIYQAQQKHLRQ